MAYPSAPHIEAHYPNGTFIEIVIATRPTAVAPKYMKGFGLIDTGSSKTCVDKKVAQELDLDTVNEAPLHSAQGVALQPSPVYGLQVSIVGEESPTRIVEAIEADLNGIGAIALIGHDILRDYRFKYDGPGWSISGLKR